MFLLKLILLLLLFEEELVLEFSELFVLLIFLLGFSLLFCKEIKVWLLLWDAKLVRRKRPSTFRKRKLWLLVTDRAAGVGCAGVVGTVCVCVVDWQVRSLLLLLLLLINHGCFFLHGDVV